MGSKLSDLASRFKSAVEAQEAERAAIEDARRKELEARRQELAEGAKAARKARKDLLQDLAAFAEEMGFLEVEQKKRKLRLSFSGLSLVFEEYGDEDRLNVEYEGAAANEALYRDADDAWVWFRNGRIVPLLDEGLEALLIKALQLPEPDTGTAGDEPKAQKKARFKGEEAHLGRSGTRGYKPAKDLPPGSVVKDYKGHGPS